MFELKVFECGKYGMFVGWLNEYGDMVVEEVRVYGWKVVEGVLKSFNDKFVGEYKVKVVEV